MRVRLTEDHRPYWNYQVVELKKGQEATGDLARYLISTGGPVEAADDEAKELAEAPAEESGGTAPREGEAGRPLADTVGDQPPVDGTIEDVLTWVGSDQERAARAIDAEEEFEEPREELVERLREIARPGPGDSAEYPEGGSAEAVKTWVGEDQERAQYALDAEEARDKPRSTLVTHLKKIAGS